jgi:hypothetical protein
LELAKSFSAKIKKTVKAESKRVFQCKAKSNNPKHFWEALSDKMGKHHEQILSLDINGIKIDNETELSNEFANFFLGKVKNLSNDPINFQMPMRTPINVVYFSAFFGVKTVVFPPKNALKCPFSPFFHHFRPFSSLKRL